MPSQLETESREQTPGGLLRTVLLVFCDGLSRTVELPPAGTISIGRDEGCDLPIDDPSVSRRHARLHIGAPFTIEDQGSHNGTRVRGVPVSRGVPVVLHPGDLIECGDATLLLRELPAAGALPGKGGNDLLVGIEGRWFQPPGGGRINLGRRGAVRRVLLRLVEQRVGAPGVGLAVEDIIQAGWPGERIQHESGLARAYVTIQRLRALGLKEVLLTRDDGYLLDPSLDVERRNDP
jgi:hypothetical protein